MAAPPQPDGGGAPVSLFLDTDLGTRLAMLVAPDTTIRRLKSQVAAEHAEAFPDRGAVTVQSLQIRLKGALYHLSQSMTVSSAFNGVKGRCFLHVNMAGSAVARRPCQSTLENDGRRTSEDHIGKHAEKHDRELPAVTLEVANDGLTHGLGVPDGALMLPSSQLDTERKNETQGPASDADIDELLKQTNISHVVEPDAKEDVLHSNQNCDVSDNKQIRIEEDILGQAHAVEYISQRKKRKKAKKNDSVHMPAADPRITNESDTMDMNKPFRDPLEINLTHGEHPNISFVQEVNGNLPEDSLRIETQSTVRKKKKRKSCQSAPSEAVSGQETTKLPTGSVGLSKSGTDAYEVNLTNIDGSEARPSVLLSSSEPNDGSQEGKHVQLLNNAQESAGLTSEQGNFDHVHNGDGNPSIADAINSTAEVPASGEKIAEGNNGSWDGGEKHEDAKQDKHNDGVHDGNVVKTSNMDKDGKTIDALQERPTNCNISKDKKRKKVKKVSSVDMTSSMDTAIKKDIPEATENAGKSDKDYTEREILHGPSLGSISDNVQHGNSNLIETPNVDGKRKKKRRRRSESLKSADPNQDRPISSEHVKNGSSIHHTNSAPVDAKQTQGSAEGATASDSNKIGERLNIAATNMIDEVLADLKSGDSLSKELELNKDLLTEQIHVDSNTTALELPSSLDSNPSALELPASTGNKVGNYAASPLKYPETVRSDALARSPSHKKPKGKQLNSLSAMIDSSHHSFGMPEEDADAKLKASDTLRFSGKGSYLKDIFTGDVVEQKDDDKAKSTKRQRKKVKKVPTDKTTQSLDEQVNQVAGRDMEGVNASIQADLVQGGSVIGTPTETVAKVQKKGKRTSKTRVSKIQEANRSTHTAKDSKDENAIDITGTHDNENASGYPTEVPVVQNDFAILKSSSPNGQKERKIHLKTELQSRDSVMQHDPSADLLHSSSGKNFVSPKNSADAVEANHCIVAHPASDKINFIEHFSSGKMNDQSVSAENVQNNEEENMEAKNKNKNSGSTEPNDLLESLLPAEKTSLTDHFGTSEVVFPSTKAENMKGEYDNVKSGKEKRKKKRKTNSEGPAADKENLDGDNQGTVIGTQNSFPSVSVMQQEPEDAVFGTTVEKKLHQHDTYSQNKFSINKDNSKISKELFKSTSQEKFPVSNLVKSFATSPEASSDSTEGTPHANRFRVALRKVPKTRQQANLKSKKETRKLGPGSIFSGDISEESDDAMGTKVEKAALESSSKNSSASANSAISSTAYDESDDDGALSLSQKSLRGLQIGSILRGSSSYKKAKQKQAELMDDDTEVPDSQPADDLWG